MRVAIAAVFAAAIVSGMPQSGEAGTTADVSACFGPLQDACAYEIDVKSLGCRSQGERLTFRADCGGDNVQLRRTDQQIFVSLCREPLCIASAERPIAKGSMDLLLGAALPLLLGALALFGAMGIRPRA